MTTLLLTVLAFAAAMLAMAVGVLLGGRRLQGSCGGEAGAACACKLAGGDRPAVCPRRQGVQLRARGRGP